MGTCREDLDLLLHSLDIIGARKVVIWSGTHAGTIYEDHADNHNEASKGALGAFLTDVVRSTRARRYSIVIEPWHGHVLDHEDRIITFHNGLPADVAERVTYVLDVPNLLTAERYPHRDSAVRSVCGAVGPLAGLVHLKDIIMPPDGEEGLAAPGQGRLDYPAYVESIFRWASPDAAAIVKNVPAADYAQQRDCVLH